MINWSKELWFALLFLTIGCTIWPLMIYYIALGLKLEFMMETSLRVWAEQIIYGPLAQINILTLRSILVLTFPYIIFCMIRFLIYKSRLEA